MNAKETALAFVQAINDHDPDRLQELMTEDHLFVDTWDKKETKAQMKEGWPGYFAWFPDYLIEVEHLFVDGDSVAIFGHASGTYLGKTTESGEYRYYLPAAWRVETVGGKVRLWQVVCDSKIPYDIMDKVDYEKRFS